MGITTDFAPFAIPEHMLGDAPVRIDAGTDAAWVAAERMQSEGGHFAAQIGAAYFYADSDNARRLVAAFQEMFRRYAVEAR